MRIENSTLPLPPKAVKHPIQIPDLLRTALTLDGVLRARAAEHGSRRLYTYLDYVQPAQNCSYAELDVRAKEIAAWLQQRGAEGERVLLIFPQGLDFIAAFFGCLYAGAIAVPAYPPRKNQKSTRIETILADSGATLALSHGDTLAPLRERFDEWPSLAALDWLAVDDGAAGLDAARWSEPEADSQRPAFLQFTSGSTGDPKGVIVTHANILSNQQHIGRAFRQRPEFHCGGWLPMYHDMGLIGNMLHPLVWGGNLAFMSPVAFLQQPIRWLRLISDYRVSISGAPNFAYQLCADETSDEERAGLDLSCWEVAYNGAEPIHAETLRRFAAAFAPYGLAAEAICPCYGMAETTLLVSGSHPGEAVITTSVDAERLGQGIVQVADPQGANSQGSDAGGDEPRTAGEGSRKALELVACGEPDPEMTVLIVDPETRLPCAANQVGEIWASGTSVAAGYWGRPEVSAATFGATLADGPAEMRERKFLRTGDLGFLHDGQLYVTGRLKDLLIVRGANHYPQDIERTVAASHEALMADAGAVFALPGEDGGSERVVVVNELQRSHLRTANHEEIFAAVRRAVASEHELTIEAIVLLRTVSIPKTSSGKIQRRLTRQMFEADELKVVGRWNRGEAAGSQELAHDELAAVEEGQLPEGELSAVTAESTATLAALSSDERLAITELEDWLIERLAARLKIAPTQIGHRQPFATFGVDSLTAVRMAGELETKLSRTISPTVAWDHRHVAGLAYFLVTGRSEPAAMPGTSQRAKSDSQEPLAVVGVGCNVPGAYGADAYWQLLKQGVCSVGETPTDRWGASLEAVAEGAGKLPQRGGFVQGVDQFDPGFFGISPREAAEMDPQQRMLLETAWQALEHAGISADSLAGTQTGVFIGVSGGDYARLQAAAWHAVSGHSATGNSMAIAANRLSYQFDFRGPCLAIDTACSSSLVAVHQAVAAIRRGECDVALAGGVSLILNPDTTASFSSQSGMLSPRGLCQTFAADADGFVRGEGCGVVVLKRLSQALADGDRILATVRGSAVNQDGRSNGLTAPNGLSQQEVIRAALADGGVDAEQVDYIEAHGTGTPLGDPIEMGSLGAVFGQRKHKLTVGSVKTNLGHLEGAAGIAGFIKTCLALHHGYIPAHLHFDRPSPHVDWSLPVEIPTAGQEWQRSEARRRLAGVSSFGFGGTNAHVILEEAPAVAEVMDVESAEGPQVLTLSAKTPTALTSLADNYQRFLLADDASARAWPAVCATANVGRAALQYRLALVAGDAEEAAARLKAFTLGDETPAWQGSATAEPPLAWLFSGQGQRFVGAGREWYDRYPGFRACLDEADQAISAVGSRSLPEMLWQDGAHWNGTDVQLGLFGFQYAWAKWWQQLGLMPRVVLGHSLGEYAAACLAGVFSLADAVKLVHKRAELMGRLPEAGGMLAVAAGAAQLSPYLSDAAELRVSLAALNGPRQTVVAGSSAGLKQLEARLAAVGIGSKPLATSHAFHSPLLDPLLDEFEATANTIEFQRPRVAYLSPVLGDWDREQVATPGYWRRQLREPVRFAAALAKLAEQSSGVWAEIGPGNVLGRLAKAAVAGTEEAARPQVLAGWPGAADEDRYLQAELGQLWAAGAAVDWRSFYQRNGKRPRPVTLPSYPFERKRYWFTNEPIERQIAAESVPTVATASSGNAWGMRLDVAGPTIVFETDLAEHAYLVDHQVGGSVVFPAAGYLALVASAAIEVAGEPLAVGDVTFQRPLTFAAGESCRVQTLLEPEQTANTYTARIAKKEADGWRVYATARLLPLQETTLASNVSSAPPPGTPIEPAEHYRRLREVGLAYGPAFQGVTRLVRVSSPSQNNEQAAWGEVRLPAGLSHSEGVPHPALLDAAFQVAAAAFGEDEAPSAWLPVGVERFQLEIATSKLENGSLVVNATVNTVNDQQRQIDLTLGDAAGNRLASITGLRVQRTALAGLPADAVDAAAAASDDLLFEEVWVPKGRRREWRGAVEATAAELARAAMQIREEVAQWTSLRAHREFLQQLETLCGYWAADALRRLGVPTSAGARFRAVDLGLELEVDRGQQRLFERLLAMVAEEGWLAKQGDEYAVKSWPAYDTASESARQLGESYPAGLPELTLVGRCAERLADVLLGEADPLPLLFPRDGSTGAADVYRDSSGGRAMNALVAEAMAEVAKHLPPGRALRVLEIGAGTGGTTSAVLPRLNAERSQYVFTDIAAGFLAPAQEQFGSYGFVVYRTLDIERDPLAQGFQPESFDLVLAANVLHAVADLPQALANIARLTTPGGQMVLLEGTGPTRWLDLTFGLTKGWWRFHDTARSDYPLIGGAAWQRLLAEAGFDESAVISPLDELDAAEAESVVVVARQATVPAPVEEVSPAIGLIGELATTASLQSALQARGRNCVLMDWPSSAASLSSVGEQLAGVSEVIVCPPRLRGAGQADALPQEVERAALGMLWAVRQVQEMQRRAGGLPVRMWLLTTAAQAVRGGVEEASLAQAAMWGMARTAALEHGDWQCRQIDLDPAVASEAAAQFVAEEVLAADGETENEVALRGEVRLARRLRALPSDEAGGGSGLAQVLEIAQRGTLASLELASRERSAPRAGEVEIAIRAAGLNFRDVLNALGLYPGTPPLGAECVGEVVRVGADVTDLQMGDAVVAIAPRTLADYVTAPSVAVARLPQGWMLPWEDTATLPVTFLTAAVALEQLGGLRREAGATSPRKVLIHAAAGGVGLAAVQLAQAAGAEIHATASPGKHAALRAAGLGRLYSSRTTEFSEEVLTATAGGGVSLVLSSLSAEFVEANLHCLAAGGLFVDIAKHTSDVASKIAALRPDVRYESFDLATLLSEQPEKVRAWLGDVLTRVAAGELRPLPRQLFPLEQAEQAFRVLQQAEHVGKVVLTTRNLVAASTDASLGGMTADASEYVAPEARADRSYLISGGLGGLGLLTAGWLLEQGAGRVVLLARRRATAGEQQQLDSWNRGEERVVVLTTDVSNSRQVEVALQQVRDTLLPIGGIFHLAGALDNALLGQQNAERLGRVLGPKVAGGWNLHRASLADPLDFFVMYGSAAGVLGSPGQANHAAANQFLDALAHWRRSEQRVAQSISWGPWAEVGAAAALGTDEQIVLAGMGKIFPSEGLCLLARCLRCGIVQVAAMRLRVQAMPAHLQSLPLFSFLTETSQDIRSGAEGASAFLALYAQSPVADRRQLLLDHVRSLVARVLGWENATAIPGDAALSDLGLDSLTALELRNGLELSLGRRFPASLVFDYPTLYDMVTYFQCMLPTEEPPGGAAPDLEAHPAKQVMDPSAVEAWKDKEGSRESQDPNASNVPTVPYAKPVDARQATPDSGVHEVLESLADLHAELEQWGKKK